MPRFDRTGPNGEGSMTGRKNGLCTGNNTGDPGMGFGRGRGRRNTGRGGFGFRFWSRAEGDSSFSESPDTVEGMKNEIEAAKEHLSELEKRLSKFKKQ